MLNKVLREGLLLYSLKYFMELWRKMDKNKFNCSSCQFFKVTLIKILKTHVRHKQFCPKTFLIPTLILKPILDHFLMFSLLNDSMKHYKFIDQNDINCNKIKNTRTLICRDTK